MVTDTSSTLAKGDGCNEDGGTVLLPVVGTFGWRCLDDLEFACQVVAHDDGELTISVQYADDQCVERGLHPDEFHLRAPGVGPSAPGDLQQRGHEKDANQHLRDDRFERLHSVVAVSGGHTRDSVFALVASFLGHFQWLQQLTLVSRRWRRALMQQENWEIVRLPQELASHSGGCVGSARYIAAIRNLVLVPTIIQKRSNNQSDDDSQKPRATVHQVVQELVFDSCPVTDALVLELVGHCQQLKRLSLQRCSQISFLLLYELTRLAKEKKSKSERFDLQHVDVWLCRGISPAYVGQLQGNGVFTRTGLNVTGPGFFLLEVSASTEQWIKASGVKVLQSSLLENDRQRQQHETLELHAEVAFQHLSVSFVPKARLTALVHETRKEGVVAGRELRNLRAHVNSFPLTVIPLVCRLEGILRQHDDLGGNLEAPQYSLVGMPSTPDDLIKMVKQYEEKHVQTQVALVLTSMEEPHINRSEDDTNSTEPIAKLNDPERDESLDTRAEKVFAMLRQTTEDLEAQVAHLESQVQQMTVAKDHAQREYQTAQLELDRVAKEADRALFRLATSSDVIPPPPFFAFPIMSTLSSFIEPNSVPQVAVAVGFQDGDELLPPLPSDKKLQGLGAMLQRRGFAVLDGFLGPDLSTSVHRNIEDMYLMSRDCNTDTAYRESNLSDTLGAASVDGGAAFKLGELAGGNTGRNLRYKMEHVRGDYMLWVDESDAFCPTTLRQVLRQMDRLVLEHLSSYNMELRASSLLRKKAMATCYPGNGARYTRHCDNPNKNGRKLTAILYLNADWKPEHGGELQLHLPPPSSLLPSRDTEVETKIAPLMDRLLLFSSDRRVPHEVLPCFKRNRFALTLWYLDYDEFMSAQVFGSVLEDECDEERRIQREIAGFANTTAL